MASEGPIDTLAELFVMRAVSRQISNDSGPESAPLQSTPVYWGNNLRIEATGKLRPATTGDGQDAGDRQAPNGQ